MTLPSFWRVPSFSVEETAGLVGVPVVTLRTWMQRAPAGDFLGEKSRGRIHFSGREVFYYVLVSKLADYGVPIRTAMYAAASYATDRLPLDDYLIVQNQGAVTNFELVDELPRQLNGAVIALRSQAIDLIGRAAKVYATEGG